MFQTLIASTTVGAGGAATIDFTSIPQTYTDLVLVASLRSDLATTTAPLAMRFNGLTTNIYQMRQLRGSGAAVTSNSNSSQNAFDLGDCIPGSSSTANTFASVALVIPNYTGSTTKIYSFDGVAEGNIASTVYQVLNTGRFSDTGAITQITINTAYNWVQHSTAYLYGTLKGSGGATVS
jgi:hypothetical protein